MKRILSVLVGVLLLSGAVTALAAGDRTASNTYPPISVWKDAPAFCTSASSGRTALTDAASPMPYIPLVAGSTTPGAPRRSRAAWRASSR
jgi:hypothetical protein